MKRIILSTVLFALFSLLCFTGNAQFSIPALSTDYTISFDASVDGVGNGVYAGTGFTNTPGVGQLDGNAWELNGMSDGNKLFDAEATTGDFARGTTLGSTTGGFYAYEVETGNFAFGMQPGGTDVTPGYIALKVINNTGSEVYGIDFSYDVWVYNNAARSQKFNGEYSLDGTNWTAIPALALNTPEAADGTPAWVKTSLTSTFNASIADAGTLYVRWYTDDLAGTGSRDKIAFDNVKIQMRAPEYVDWCNLSTPSLLTINQGSTGNIYGEVLKTGVTEAVGQGANIQGFVYYNTANTDPSTWSNFINTAYNQDAGNNDEYSAALGIGLTHGTYYYATAFSFNNGPKKFGGYNTGFWDGTTNVSGELHVAGMEITAPAISGTVFHIGDIITVTWTSSHLTGNVRIAVDLNNGSGYFDVSPDIDIATGTYDVPIPSDAGEATGASLKIYLVADNTINDVFSTFDIEDLTAPEIETLNPANAAVDVPISQDLVVTFDENVALGTGNVNIKKYSDNSIVQTIDITTCSVSGDDLTINPTDLDYSTQYYVETDNTAIDDLYGNDFAGITGNSVWSFTTEGEPCYNPTLLSAQNITGTSADLGWTAGGSEAAWDIEIGAVGFTPGTGAALFTFDDVTTNPYNATGLSQLTSYEFYVRAVCGSENSEWTGPHPFATVCSVLPLTVFEGFNTSGTAVFPACWSQQYVTGTSNLTFVTSGSSPTVSAPYEGSRMVYWNSYSISTGNQTRLVSAPISTTGVTNVDVEFYWYHSNSGSLSNNEGVQVQYSTDGTSWTDAGSFVPRYNAATGWVKKTVTLANAGNQTIFVGLLFKSNYGYNCYLDAFTVKPGPTCLPPSALNASAVTHNSATIGWTASSSSPSDGYDIYYSTSSTAPDGTTTPTASVTAGTTTYNMTGLSATTTYYVWVRSNCGSGDVSGWSTVFSFTTPCAPVTSLPWTEGYEGLSTVGTTTFPSCWLEGTGTNWRSMNASTTTYNDPRTGTKYAGCYYGGTADRLWTPGFELTQDVSYDFSVYFVGDGYAGWNGDIIQNTAQSATGETVLGSSFITSSTTSTNGTNYTKITRTFVPSTTGVYYFGIRVTASSTPWGYLAFDDFSLSLTPNCVNPTNLTASSITNNSAVLGWTASTSSPANGYDIYYSTSSTAPDGTTTPSGSVAAGITTYNMTGLTASTTYYAWVRSHCASSEYSEWTGPVTLTTMCDPTTTFPYTEAFGTYLPTTCWKEGDNGDPTTGPVTISATASSWSADGFLNSGTTGAAKVNIDATGDNDWIISPQFTIPASPAYRFTYSVGATQYAGTGAPTTPWEADDFVQVLVSTTGYSNWTQVKIYNSANVPSHLGQTDIIDLSAYAGQTITIAFRGVEGADNGGADIDFFTDNWVIEETPQCSAPASLTATGITGSQANLGWTETGTSTTWDIELGPTGFSPTGTPTMNDVTANPYTYTGLTPQTTYQFYVRSDCGATQSTWTGPISFTTAQVPATLTFTEGFETWPNGWTVVNGTQTNQWYVGTATAHTGTQSAYISNDAGVTNAYTITSTSVVHMYRDITIPATTNPIGVKFYWKGQGEGTAYDRMRVYMVATSVAPVAGTELTSGQVGLTNYNLQSNWTLSSFELPAATYANQTWRMVFSWKNDNTSGTQPPIAFDDLEVSIVTCPKPTTLNATDIQSDQATLGWTETGVATSWDIELGVTGFTPTGVPTQSGVTNPYIYTSLNPATTYQFYVRADCGGEYSDWAGPMSFTTLCAPLETFPYSEPFNTYLPTICWSEGDGGDLTAGPITISSTAASWANDGFLNSGTTGAARITIDAAADNDWIITPEFTIPAGNPYRLTYSVGATQNASTNAPTNPWENDDFVEVLITTHDYTDWVAIYTYTSDNVPLYTGQTDMIDLSSFEGLTVRFAFRGVEGADNGSANIDFFVDNLVIEEIPGCEAPTGLTATGITNSAAEVNWTASTSSPADGYDIYYSNSSTAPDEETVPSGHSDGLTYSMSSLTSATTYYVWVRSDCGSGNYSIWAGPISFTTDCDPVAAYPYLQSFSATMPTCWFASEGSSGASYHWAPTTADVSHGSSAPQSGTHFMYLNVYNASTSYNPYYLTTQSFDLGSTVKYLSYYYYLGNSGYTSSPVPLTVQISTDDGATWSDLYSHITANSTFASTGTGWYQNEVNLAAYVDATVMFRFKSNSNYGSSFCNQGLDEFSIYDAPSCLPPTDLDLTSVFANTATIGWTASYSNPADGYDIYMSLTNTPPDEETTPTETVLAGVTTFTWSDLTENTNYFVWVRANCGGGDMSNWTSVLAFSTTCPAIANYPYFEGFNAAAFPECWSKLNIDGGNEWVTSTTNPYEGTHAVRVAWNTAGNNDWLISPQLDINTENLMVEFYARSHNSTLLESFNVLVSTTGTDPEDFSVVLDNVTNLPAVYTKFTYLLSDFGIELGSQIYVAIQCVSFDEFYLYVDAFTVKAANDEADIIAYSLPQQTGAAVIDADHYTVNIEVGNGTALDALVANFTLSDGATAQVAGVDQVSGTTANDFTNPVTYTVTSENGAVIHDWVVTVTVADVYTEANILTYAFDEQTAPAIISSDDHTVDININWYSDITDLIADFTLSYGASATIDGTAQVSGTTSNDFSAPVVYNVLAEDGTTNQDWTVTVTQDAPPQGLTCDEAIPYTINDPDYTGYMPAVNQYYFLVTLPHDYTNVEMMTCGSDFDTKLAYFISCDDVPDLSTCPDDPAGNLGYQDDGGCTDQSYGGNQWATYLSVGDLSAGTYLVAVYGYDQYSEGNLEFRVLGDEVPYTDLAITFFEELYGCVEFTSEPFHMPVSFVNVGTTVVAAGEVVNFTLMNGTTELINEEITLTEDLLPEQSWNGATQTSMSIADLGTYNLDVFINYEEDTNQENDTVHSVAVIFDQSIEFVDAENDTITVNEWPYTIVANAIVNPTVPVESTFLWDGGETTNTLEVNDEGWYYLTISTADCEYIDSVYVAYYNSISKPSIPECAVYPNPTNGIVELNIALPSTGNVTIQIIDALGKTVNEIVLNGFNTISKQVDLSGYAEGVYSFRFIMNDRTITKRVVLKK